MTDRRLLTISILSAVATVAIYYVVIFVWVIPAEKNLGATQTPRPQATLPYPFLIPTEQAPIGPTVIYIVVTATPPPEPRIPVTVIVVVTATTAPTFPTFATPPCECDRNRYNCGRWDSRPPMQACYDYCMSLGRGDIHDLDGDNDGIPCEHLR